MESAVDERPTCDLILISFRRPVDGVIKSIKRHRCIFFENNNEFVIVDRRPSSSISRINVHSS